MPDKKSRLTHVELAAIDFTITALQAAGHKIDEVGRNDNPHEQMAEAWADAHHPFVELNERDQEIIGQMKVLAGQLSARTSLPQLLNARGKILQGK